MMPQSALYRALVDGMSRHPHAEVHHLDQVVSFGALLTDSDRKRRDLRRVVEPQSRVLVTLRNHPGYISTLLALLADGHFPILADPALGGGEIRRLIDVCGIRHHVTATPTSDSLAVDDVSGIAPTGFDGVAPELASDSVLGRLTSGSTRLPACIEFSADAVISAATTWTAGSGLTDADRTLLAAGFANGLAFNTTLIPSLLTGADMVLMAGLPRGGTVLRETRRLRPTVLTAFPALYDALAQFDIGSIDAESAAAMRGLRLRLSSAAPMNPDSARALAEMSGHVNDYYGIAETGPVTFNPGSTNGSQGRPLAGVTIDFDDQTAAHPGRMRVRTPSMGTRYLNYPGEFEKRVSASGAYLTSDRGELVDGELRLHGRVEELLNVGGNKFTPESVAAPILDFGGVIDCRVVQFAGAGDRKLLGAVVQSETGCDEHALRGHLRNHLAAFKVPELIVTVDRLPTGQTGKVPSAAVEELLQNALMSRSDGRE
ncbi:MAG: class I adenylate-forming enzyme family protein [Actinomycetota bacterium]|nr:class I adenylate-forming enzyme family protein [Actinomycetota bacterium]